MTLRRRNPHEGAMVRHSTPLQATFLALLLTLLVAGPAFAYGNVNPLHLRLSRLDPMTCEAPIRIKATLTERTGDPVRGATVEFAIDKGVPGDALAPASAVTDALGQAVTYLTLVCTDDTHHIQVLATGPDGAKARINLILHKDGPNGDEIRAVTSLSSGFVGALVTIDARARGRSPQ